MASRLLSLPSDASGAPSGYTPTQSDLRALVTALSGATQDIAINQAGEGMSADYPTSSDVATFVQNGGIYVDWCGYPMWYVWTPAEYSYNYYINDSWDTEDHQRFFRFLESGGVDTGYINGFEPYPDCPQAKYARECMSNYSFPASNSVIISPQVTTKCGEPGLYGYDRIAIQIGSGWYFWAYGANSGAHVSAADYAAWIAQVSGVSVSSGSGTGGSYSGIAEAQCLASGGQWVNGQCVGGTGGSSGGAPSGGTGGSPGGSPSGGSSSGGGFLSSLTTLDKVIGVGAIMAAFGAIALLLRGD